MEAPRGLGARPDGLARGSRAGRRPPPRLETQVLHLEEGSWRPYTYVWNDEQSDATLADAGGSSRTFFVRDEREPRAAGATQAYRFAARSECVLCHNPWVEARTTVFGAQSASPLAFDAPQLDRDGPATGGREPAPPARAARLLRPAPAAPRACRRLADPYDESAGLDARARCLLQVNCAHCHQSDAGGSADDRPGVVLPLEQTETVGVRPIQGTFGIDDARIIAPGEPERSVLYYRMAKRGPAGCPGSARSRSTTGRRG